MDHHSLINHNQAYLFVFHGSSDPRPQQEASYLMKLITAQLQTNSSDHNNHNLEARIALTSLEFAEIPLQETIINFAHQMLTQGINQIKIIPLFLLPGFHVTQELPEIIALAQKQLDHKVKISLDDYLGSYPQMEQFLREYWRDLAGIPSILLAHGSRKIGGNQAIIQLANQIESITAYWSCSPNLSEQVALLINRGVSAIAIYPYFLFSGKTTDAIAQLVTQLQQQFPETKIILGQNLGATPQLANLCSQRIK